MSGLAGRSSTILVALVLVPASAGASAGRPPVALTATPARVLLTGSARTRLRVTNSGAKPVAVDVSRAGFALDVRGRPRIVRSQGARSAAGWLTLRPAHFTIGPRSAASLALTAKVPPDAEPGDHDALALLRTRPIATGRVAVQLRLGVVVVVRAPGEIVRRLELRRLRVVRRGRVTALEVSVTNIGNVTEPLQGARAVLARTRGGPVVATATAPRRDLRPRTGGIVAFHFRRPLHGPMTAEVVIPADGSRGRSHRTYWITL
jgi:hypothetical protein